MTRRISRGPIAFLEAGPRVELRLNADQSGVPPRISANSREALRRMTRAQASFSPFLICVVVAAFGVPLIAYAPTRGYARAATRLEHVSVGGRPPSDTPR